LFSAASAKTDKSKPVHFVQFAQKTESVQGLAASGAVSQIEEMG
jgi:hypothetical protein